MKRILLLFVEFVALTVPLTWAWRAWLDDPYDALLFQILDALYQTIGGVHAGRGPVGHRFVSYVPFLVLVAITPALSLRRRLWGAGLGSLAIFASHVVMLAISDAAYTVQRGTGWLQERERDEARALELLAARVGARVCEIQRPSAQSIERSRFAISIAAIAASKPLLPAFVPDRSIACSIVSVVSTPKVMGTEDSDAI